MWECCYHILALLSEYTKEQESGLAIDLEVSVQTVKRRAKAAYLRKEFEAMGWPIPDLQYSKYEIVARWWTKEEISLYDAWSHLETAKREGTPNIVLAAIMSGMHGEVKTWRDYGKRMVSPAKNIMIDSDATAEAVSLATETVRMFG